MKRPAKMDLEEVCGIHNKRQMEDNLETTNQLLTKSAPKINYERLSKEMLKAWTTKAPTREQVPAMKTIEASLTRVAMHQRGCLFR
jgi:fumarate hydratase class II